MLRGQKVILRAMTPQDLERLWEFNNDVEVELAGGGDPPLPQSLARLQADYEAKLGQGEREGTGFAIEADHKFIGHCALFRFDQVARTCELGITIGDKDYWGQGYGREAIGLLLDYGFRFHNLHRVFLTVNGNNERAIRAYQACGFVAEGRLRAHVWHDDGYVDLVYMGLLREEWKNLRQEKADF
jgi:RimJ/RimL family protein N-acetyltransferase